MKKLIKLLSVFVVSFSMVFAAAFAGCNNDTTKDDNGQNQQPDDNNGENNNNNNNNNNENNNENNNNNNENNNDNENNSGDNTDKNTVYDGDYHYDVNYGTILTYGIKVKVTVNDENVIQSVAVEDSDYIEVSDSMTEYGWDNSVWTDNLNALLAKYEGKTVAEVMAIPVYVNEIGQPNNDQDYSGLVTTGSTQSSGRLLLAVQDALKGLGFGVGGPIVETPDEPETPEDNTYTANINLGETTWTVDGEDVSYTIVTLGYGKNNTRPAPFTIKVVVGSEKTIKSFEVVTNGSTPSTYGEKMTDVSAFVGKDLSYFTAIAGSDMLYENIAADDAIHTGATQSNYICMCAAAYAIANYETSLASPKPYAYTDNINLGETTWTVSGDVVTYTITTLGYGKNSTRPAPFTIKVVVGSDKTITSFEVVTNGSTPSTYGEKMTDVSAFVGQNLSYFTAIAGTDMLYENIAADDAIHTGATQSNYICMSVAAFALANYDSCLASPKPFAYTDNINMNATTWTESEGKVTYTIVTLGYGKNSTRPAPFTIKVVVGSDKTIESFTVITNGSTPATYGDKMTDVSAFVGQKLSYFTAIAGTDMLYENIADDDAINTGATQSNYICMSAAAFALANYDTCAATSNPYAYDEYIDVANSSWTVAGDVVTYTITTLGYGKNSTRPAPFTINVVVGSDKTITSFTVVTNGSTPASYGDKMTDVSAFVGQNLSYFTAIAGAEMLYENIADDDAINTGATQSNYICMNVAAFALANYDAIVG